MTSTDCLSKVKHDIAYIAERQIAAFHRSIAAAENAGDGVRAKMLRGQLTRYGKRRRNRK